MSVLITIGKIFATLFIVIFFLAGALKANPRSHVHGAAAEYMAGFLICSGCLIGLYHLWIK
jgi:hypothetical protein